MRHGNVRIPRRISQQSKGEGTAPPSYWMLRIALKKFIVLFRDDNSSENVTMPAEIFRCGMQD